MGPELVLTVEATELAAMEVMGVMEVVEEGGDDDELELVRSGELRLGPLSWDLISAETISSLEWTVLI